MEEIVIRSSNRLLFRPLALLLGLLCAAVVHALPTEELYSARVQVADHSPAARVPALANGLARVLVKVTGDSRILRRSEVRNSLGRADSLMSEFGYFNFDDADAEKTLGLEVRFQPRSIDQLVRRLGLPVWPASRSRMTIWLVVDTP